MCNYDPFQNRNIERVVCECDGCSQNVDNNKKKKEQTKSRRREKRTRETFLN